MLLHARHAPGGPEVHDGNLARGEVPAREARHRSLSSRRPSSGGKSVAGTGLPISAEGSREGSPERRANANSPAMAANNRSGTTNPSRRRGRSASRARADAGPCRPPHPAWTSPLAPARSGARVPAPRDRPAAGAGGARPDEPSHENREDEDGGAVRGPDERRVRAQIGIMRSPPPRRHRAPRARRRRAAAPSPAGAAPRCASP